MGCRLVSCTPQIVLESLCMVMQKYYFLSICLFITSSCVSRPYVLDGLTSLRSFILFTVFLFKRTNISSDFNPPIYNTIQYITYTLYIKVSPVHPFFKSFCQLKYYVLNLFPIIKSFNWHRESSRLEYFTGRL